MTPRTFPGGVATLLLGVVDLAANLAGRGWSGTASAWRTGSATFEGYPVDTSHYSRQFNVTLRTAWSSNAYR